MKGIFGSFRTIKRYLLHARLTEIAGISWLISVVRREAFVAAATRVRGLVS